MEKILENVGVGEVFKVAGFDFIKFYDENGKTVAVAKHSWFNSKFGENNNLAESKILKKLKEEFLPKIEAAIGAENILEHEVDLLSLDGSEKWGKIREKISLPTFDFYRKHVKIFDKHKVNNWWWLATPDATSEHLNDDCVRCVAPAGSVNYIISHYYNSVRPFCVLKSSISVYCKD